MSYIDSAPAGVDESFDWRDSIPGRLRMRLAPQYWVWKAEQFDQRSADRYFSGFVGHLVTTLAEPDRSAPDMRAVLEVIEQLVPGTASGPSKTFMVAIYALWHRIAAAELHRPSAERFLEKYEDLLQVPEVSSFVVGLWSGSIPEWSTEDWRELAVQRRDQRSPSASKSS
ncbi:MAG TPA: hypothetical protein VGX69_04455 [Solirubrobacteraceae bacterium]|jgi:hypothetical protein|nr:hypothetical protein [Solirubrobacteraceae bacterium]